MANTRRNRDNKEIRKMPGGPELLEAIDAMNNVERALIRRADDGDELAGHKVATATVDRLVAVRKAMLEAIPPRHRAS